LLENSQLVLNALVNVLEFQIASSQGDGLRDALGNQAGLYSRQPRQRDCCAVMGVEAFGLDSGLTVNAKAAFAVVLLGLAACGKLRSGGSREEPNGAVGEHAIHVKHQQFNLACPLQRHGRMIANQFSASRFA